MSKFGDGWVHGILHGCALIEGGNGSVKELGGGFHCRPVSYYSRFRAGWEKSLFLFFIIIFSVFFFCVFYRAHDSEDALRSLLRLSTCLYPPALGFLSSR